MYTLMEPTHLSLLLLQKEGLKNIASKLEENNHAQLQKQTLQEHCDVIAGAAESVAQCRGMGLKIGSSTGYTRELMKLVYEPEVELVSDVISGTRTKTQRQLRIAALWFRRKLRYRPTKKALIDKANQVQSEKPAHARRGSKRPKNNA